MTNVLPSNYSTSALMPRVALSFVEPSPPSTSASHRYRSCTHQHLRQEIHVFRNRNADSFSMFENRLLVRRPPQIAASNLGSHFKAPYSDPIRSSSRTSIHTGNSSLYKRRGVVDPSGYSLSGLHRRKSTGRTGRTGGRTSALSLGTDGPLAGVAEVLGTEKYGEILGAVRGLAVSLPEQIDLGALQLSVPTNEAMFNVYGGIYTSISTSLSGFWMGIQLPGGDVSQTIIFYVALLLLLYGLVLQPK